MINVYQPTLGKEELDALQEVLSLTGLAKASELLSLRKICRASWHIERFGADDQLL